MSLFTSPSRTVPDVQPQARALGDPTRFRIFRYIFESARPVGVAELTSYMQLNHNAVRQHLEVLTSASLVVEGQEKRTRPGRPRLLYEAAPGAAGLWGSPGPYEQLATALAEAMRSGTSTEEVGRRAGLARAREVSRRGAVGDPVEVIEHEMARAEFRPVRRQRARGAELVLENCPFESAAAVNPKAVCQFHLGLAEGLAEGVGGIEVEDLVRKNPHRAGCRLLVREPGWLKYPTARTTGS
jgi:predicted ArsR family transcriptional regulator